MQEENQNQIDQQIDKWETLSSQKVLQDRWIRYL
jgi:hypothetical protein